MVIGNLNAKVGAKVQNDFSIAPYGLGIRNKMGSKHIELANKINFKIANTFFEKRLVHKWTWIFPNRQYKNEIDYCLINDMTIMKNINVLGKFEFQSDHRIVCYTLQIPRRAKTKNYYKNKNKGNMKTIIPLHNLEEANEYMKLELGDYKNTTCFLNTQELYD